LLRLGACFGPVKSHKAIINQDTGLCKGYGFVMYEHAHDAETALHQLPLHGLTTSWAKESFSTKLRKLSDNTTSNVYVSNLPMDMSPHQLEQLFAPHLVVSLRILLDDNGASRGVGFVRLRDRDTAQECIDKLHGKVSSVKMKKCS
jgi:RNA recognition motif-containing protein